MRPNARPPLKCDKFTSIVIMASRFIMLTLLMSVLARRLHSGSISTHFMLILFFFFCISSPQGIAFRNIPLDKELYAMVCSTSAKSSVRLINTTSFRDCLQFRCMKVITKYPQLLDVSFKQKLMEFMLEF